LIVFPILILKNILFKYYFNSKIWFVYIENCKLKTIEYRNDVNVEYIKFYYIYIIYPFVINFKYIKLKDELK